MNIYIRSRKMSDIESEMYIMCESDKAFQKAINALNGIGCASFTLSKEEIRQMFEDVKDGRYWEI